MVPLRRSRAERRILAGLALLVLAIVFVNHFGEFTPDTKPILYMNPWATLRDSLTSWQSSPYQAGTANFGTGLAPVAALIAIIRSTGLPPWATIRLWRAGLMVFGAWGATRLYHHFEGERSNATGRIATAVAFVANPFVIIAGGTTPLLLPYALLPWMLLCFARAVREPRSWRWPAAFALTFFAMSGMQAGVVPLLLVLSVPVYAVYACVYDGAAVRPTFVTVVKCGGLALCISLYWLVPSLFAASAGAAVVAESEDPRLVALTSSFAEGIRMLGLWPMYGQLGGRLFMPKGLSYVVNPIVVLGSFMLPIGAAAGAWLSRSRARAFAVMLLVLALPVFVGLFPGDSHTPFGRMINAVFTKVPGAIAFRTTVKISPLIVLSFVLLIGFGAGALRRRNIEWLRPGPLTGMILALWLVAAGVYPALSNNLYNQGWAIPSYWKQAAADINSGPSTSRVIVAPGSVSGNYRWGPRSSDDILGTIFTRPTVARLTTTQGSLYPANFLSAMDLPLSIDRSRPEVYSTMARYFGISDVLVRNDLRWEETQGARPAVVNDQLLADTGLRRATSYGPTGLYTTAPEDVGNDPAPVQADQSLEPITTYTVADPVPIVRAEAGAGTVLIDGDNFAVPDLIQLGMMAGRPAYRLAGMTTSDELAKIVGDGGRLELTDSNRRRIWSVHRTDDGYSETLAADDSIVAATATSMTLFPQRTETQTVATLDGAVSITGQGGSRSFGITPIGPPSAAFDGDPDTAWIASDFGNARGSKLTVTFDHPRVISQVTIDPNRQKPVQVGGVRVSTDTDVKNELVPKNGSFVVTLDNPGPTTHLTVEITDTTGIGTNPVGISEVSIDGSPVTPLLQMPTTLTHLAEGLTPDQRAAMDKLPFDVVMNREAGGPKSKNDDEEGRLLRAFDLPMAHEFHTIGRTTEGAAASELALNPHIVNNADLEKCIRIGTIDDQPLNVKFAGTPTDLRKGHAVDIGPCFGDSVKLGPGHHVLKTDPGWPIDLLSLTSIDTAPATQPSAAPKIDVTRDGETSKEFQAEASDHPYYLVTGIGYEPRWHGFMDGKPLGPPTLIDGYALGWRIDSPGPHAFTLTFGPQAPMNLALVFSLATGALCCAMILWSQRRRLLGGLRRERAAQPGPNMTPA